MENYRITETNIDEILTTQYKTLQTADEFSPVSSGTLWRLRKSKTASIKTILKVRKWLDKYGLTLKYEEQEQ